MTRKVIIAGSSILIVLTVWIVSDYSYSKRAVRYTVTDLGTLAGESTRATDINNRGEIVGLSGRTAFHWDKKNGMTKIGDDEAFGCRINDQGTIAVTFNVEVMPDGFQPRAYVLKSGEEFLDVGMLGTRSDILLNSKGWVSWQCLKPDSLTENEIATLQIEDPNHEIKKHGVHNHSIERVTAINERNKVLGTSWDVTGTHHTFLIDLENNSTILNPIKEKMGLAGLLLNDEGWIVGVSKDSADSLPSIYLWDNIKLKPLDGLGGDTRPTGMNNHGQIVGRSETRWSHFNRGFAVRLNRFARRFPWVNWMRDAALVKFQRDRPRAVLWEGEVVRDLNDLIGREPDWLLESATDINDEGYIVGYGFLTGKRRAFLLTPIEEASADEG